MPATQSVIRFMRTAVSLLPLLVPWFLGPGVAVAGEGWVEGVTEPYRDVTLAFPVFGVVAVRHVEEGDEVRRGQVLVELDKRLEQLEVKRRQHAADLARTGLERLQALASKQTISVSQEELDQKRAESLIAQTELELAREALDRRLLTSPIDGFVVELLKEVGEAFEERDQVARVVDTRRCYFIANVEASDGLKLKPGDPVVLVIGDGGTGMKSDAVLSYVSPVVDPASGLLRVKAVFDNADLRIRPGVLGRMQLP